MHHCVLTGRLRAQMNLFIGADQSGYIEASELGNILPGVSKVSECVGECACEC